jgi:2-polyprenyl-3-methyl-5-hydroxy-6-metoxy-1,4-benzoquinol methylase
MSNARRPCPICGASNWRPLYAPLIQCSDCTLVATDQDRSPIRASVYDAAYFTQRNAYLTAADKFLPFYTHLLDQLSPFKPSGVLLDVGCGVGHLVAAANAAGYQARGCDVAAWATEYARAQGQEVATGPVEEIGYGAASFDIVVANHTLEHIGEPLPFLQELHRTLAGDGLLAVGVPNFGSLFSVMMRSRWAGLLPDQHYWHFSVATLARLFEQGASPCSA